MDVHTHIIHYYFGVLPSPWNNSLCENLEVFQNQRAKHTTHHKKNKKHQTTQVPQICGNYPAKMERSQASSKLFWGGVGTQTSKNSSATIFNHQGKVSRKASHELFFGVISATHHPNQIKLTHPRLIPHHTKKKHIEQLKCHKFVGTTLPKKGQKSGLEHFFFLGGLSSNAPWNN